MTRSNEELWHRFRKYYREFPTLGLSIDVSRLNFPDDFLERMSAPIQKALIAMAELEKGAISNPDEKRMVGHYWLRRPALAPTATIREEIEKTLNSVEAFASKVHSGEIKGAGGTFQNLLLIGIGGSALGPQFVSDALGHPARDKIRPFFFDNTDPDGMERILASLATELNRTLCVVISKSGATKETRNGMLQAEAAYKAQGVPFARHAVAVTGALSELDNFAAKNQWLARFPMWDWVGGRTSVLSAVGLLPAALQGIEIRDLLRGAAACDEVTRTLTVLENPAALMALMWFHAGSGRGLKDLVVLPYKDRLALFSKYLQQLIMESLGKERDVNDNVVHQGLAVYGNKGSTDQHAYVQQLREGIHNFFVTFIEVLRDGGPEDLEVEPGVTAGDYLSGFFLGTRAALTEKERESLTLTILEVSAFHVGVLIALFERTVGLYATLIGVNAYHQPGVEAGKKAAAKVISLQARVVEYLRQKSGHPLTAAQIASGVGAHGDFESVFKIVQHLAANPWKRIHRSEGAGGVEATFEFR